MEVEVVMVGGLGASHVGGHADGRQLEIVLRIACEGVGHLVARRGPSPRQCIGETYADVVWGERARNGALVAILWAASFPLPDRSRCGDQKFNTMSTPQSNAK